MCAKILVAEADMMQAFDMMSGLEEAGHQIIGPAPHLDLALMLAESTRPDVALVDLVLRDGERGRKLARELRERGIPSVFVSAKPTPVFADAPAGLRDRIVKPLRRRAIARGVSLAQQGIAGHILVG